MACLPSRRLGMTLLEVAMSLTLLGVILFGVMGALSTGFMAQRTNSELLETQLLTRQVVEEVRSAQFDTLLSFNGTIVTSTSGKIRANITATSPATNLVQIRVSTTCSTNPQASMQVVTLLSNPE